MRYVTLAAIAAAAITATPSFAADLPVKARPMPVAAAYSWTGVYAGINGGIMWNRYNWTNNAGVSTGDFSGNGAVLGGTLGANWQMPGTKWVLGVEGDWDWSNSKATTNAQDCGTCEEDVRWLATARGRVGYAVIDRLLAYATGGAAWAKFSPSSTATAGLTDYTLSGWTLGGGLEYAVWRRFSVKAEYLYLGFKTSPVFFAPTGISGTTRMSAARVGLNYRFQ